MICIALKFFSHMKNKIYTQTNGELGSKLATRMEGSDICTLSSVKSSIQVCVQIWTFVKSFTQVCEQIWTSVKYFTQVCVQLWTFVKYFTQVCEQIWTSVKSFIQVCVQIWTSVKSFTQVCVQIWTCKLIICDMNLCSVQSEHFTKNCFITLASVEAITLHQRLLMDALIHVTRHSWYTALNVAISFREWRHVLINILYY